MDEIMELIEAMTRVSLSREVFNLYELGEISDDIIDNLIDNNYDVSIETVYQEVSKELSKGISKHLFKLIVLNELEIAYNISNNYDQFKKILINSVAERIKKRENAQYYLNLLENIVDNIKSEYEESKQIQKDFDVVLPILTAVEDKFNNIEVEKPLVNFTITYNDMELRYVLSIFTSQREIVNKYIMIKTNPKWYMLFPTKDRMKDYFREKIIKYYVDISKRFSEAPAISMDELEKNILSNKRVSFSTLSNEELLELFERLVNNDKVKQSQNVGDLVSYIDQLLEEFSKRSLSEEQRKRFTKLLAQYLSYMNNIKRKVDEDIKKTKVVKDLISENLHNIEITDEFMREVMKISQGFADAIYAGKAEEIAEEDPMKALELLSNVTNIEQYEDLVSEYINRIKELKLSQVMEKVRGTRFIDYKRTIYKTVKYRVPILTKYEQKKSLNNVYITIDASGSMETSFNFRFSRAEKELTQLKVAVLTSYIILRAMQEVGADNFKLYLFAEKMVDLTDLQLRDILKLLSKPEVLHEIVGAGTELAGALLRISKKVESDSTLILITDTGDSSVTPELVRVIKDRVKTLVVMSPEKYFDETARAFKKAGVEVFKYNSFDEMLDKFIKIIDSQISD